VKPNISEFSYGYALTDELIHSHGVPINAAPVFPSLYDEGQVGGGWDLKLSRPSVPLFLQFKLSECMTRRNCQEVRRGLMPVPCYRMHVRPSRFSRQHELLLDLEAKGHEVYYSAPAFHGPDELNEAYLQREVKSRSLWLRPSQIGPLPDDQSHHVSFRMNEPWYFCSEPRRGETKGAFDDFVAQMQRILYAQGETGTSESAFEKLAADIEQVAQRRPDVSVRVKDDARRVLETASPVKRVAYYASVFLESQLFVVSRPEAQAEDVPPAI